MVLVNEYLKSCFSVADAEKLNSIIEPLIEKKEKIVIDFSEIRAFTTLFFNLTLSKCMAEIGPCEYEKMFKVINLSPAGEDTYLRSFSNAKNLFTEKNQREPSIDTSSEKKREKL